MAIQRRNEVRVEESMAQKGVDWKVGSRSEAVSPGASEEGGLLTFWKWGRPLKKTRSGKDETGSLSEERKAQPFGY